MDDYRGAGLRGFFRQSPVVLVQFVKVTLFFIKGGEDGSIGNLRVSEKMYFTGEEYAEKYRGDMEGDEHYGGLVLVGDSDGEGVSGE